MLFADNIPAAFLRVVRRSLVAIALVALMAGGPVGATAQQVRPPELAREYHRAEMAWRGGGSLYEAKARLDRVLDARPRDHDALVLRARVLLEMDRIGAAYRDVRAAVHADSSSGEARVVLARAARLSGETLVAVEQVRQAAQMLPASVGLHLELSHEAMALGLYEEAEALARVALALDEQNAAAYLQLARVFAIQGDVENAGAVLDRGLDAGILTPQHISSDSLLHAVPALPGGR